MNETDKKIARILSKDARITNAKLAKAIELSPSATLERVRHLERDGIIEGYTAKINPEKMGRGFEVIMTFILKIESRDDVDSFIAAMQKADEVVTCAQVLGRYEFIIHIAVKNIDALNDFINNKIRAFPYIERMETLTVLKMVKRNAPICPL